MPHLVSGHIRFTEEDSMKSDYYSKINLECTNQISPEVTRLFYKIFKKNDSKQISNYIDNEKKALSDTLFTFLLLANNMGYTLDDLMKYKL